MGSAAVDETTTSHPVRPMSQQGMVRDLTLLNWEGNVGEGLRTRSEESADWQGLCDGYGDPFLLLFSTLQF